MTMDMGIGTNINDADAGEVKGKQDEIACGVWFTASGRTIPKCVKFKDRDGVYHILNHISVLDEMETHYCGIPAITYKCETVYNNRKIEFHLLFYIERKQWKILWKNIREF
ncbi:MAG: hypothetical protein ACK5LL_14280 [Suipraeoptans sp.]